MFKTEGGDREDFLRRTDRCAGKNGSISRKNCQKMKVPRCNKNKKFGPQKLCINRAYEPGTKKREWWVAISMIMSKMAYFITLGMWLLWSVFQSGVSGLNILFSLTNLSFCYLKENCDKCFCGKQQKPKSKSAYCKFVSVK